MPLYIQALIYFSQKVVEQQSQQSPQIEQVLQNKSMSEKLHEVTSLIESELPSIISPANNPNLHPVFKVGYNKDKKEFNGQDKCKY